jgi:hypothetical protein
VHLELVRWQAELLTLVGQILEVRLTAATVEVMHKGMRVAAHPRYGKERYTTLSEHMPKSHREHFLSPLHY